MFGLFTNVCGTENLAFLSYKIGRESESGQNMTNMSEGG